MLMPAVGRPGRSRPVLRVAGEEERRPAARDGPAGGVEVVAGAPCQWRGEAAAVAQETAR